MTKIPFPQAVLFDKDGTLLHFDRYWIPVADAAVGEILRKYEGERLRERVMRALGVAQGKTDVQGILCGGTYGDIAVCIGHILKDEGIPFEEIALKTETVQAFENSLGEGEIAPTCEGLKETLQALKAKGAKLFVVTNDNHAVTEFCLQGLGIGECFDGVIADGDGLPSKPDGGIVEYLASQYGFEKGRMVMVGDSPTDMLFAKNGGIASIGVGEGRELLRAMATAIVPTVREIFEGIGS